MPRTTLAPCVLFVLLAACDERQLAYYTVDVVDATGEFPVEDGTITFTVKHRGQVLECNGEPCSATIEDGDFRLDLPLASFEGMTQIQVEIVDENGERWIGATPPFQPFGEGLDVAPRLRVLVGRPSSCARLDLDGLSTGDPPVLAPPRAHAAAVVRRNVVLLVGGEQADGDADDHVTRFDQLTLDADSLPSLDDPLGPAHGLSLSEDVSLVVGARAFMFERNATGGPPKAREIDLHEGAGFTSAVVSLGTSGGAVLGGGGRGVSWVTAEGDVDARTSQLAVSRTSPAAARLDDGILVVGGAAGGPGAEWLPISGTGRALNIDVPVASGGVLHASPDATAALWIGYEDENGASAEMVVVRGCPNECTVESAAWDRARRNFAAVTTAAGTLWLLGGESDADPTATRAIDVITWRDGAPRVERGPELPLDSAGAVAFEHASGIVTIAGGRALSEDIVICFPAELDPI